MDTKNNACQNPVVIYEIKKNKNNPARCIDYESLSNTSRIPYKYLTI